MKFKLEVELGNDGMQDWSDIADATERVLSRMVLSDRNKPIPQYANIHDANGNTVGSWSITE